MPHRRRSDRVFGALLRLFPSEFRGDFGDQMSADFQDRHQEVAHRRGASGVARLWARTCADMAGSALREHFDVLRRDGLQALRALRRRPASTATVVLSLIIGIGLNTALFSVVRGVLWRDLPFPDSDRLVRISSLDSTSSGFLGSVSPGEFVDLQAHARTFSALGAGTHMQQTIVEPGEPESIEGMTVTQGFFDALGARPVLGRTFTADEFRAAGTFELRNVEAINARLQQRAAGLPPTQSAVIISHALWQRRFLGRADIIGRQLRLASGIVAEVVGVMGVEMSSLVTPLSTPPDWWMPQVPLPADRRGRRLDLIGRLAPQRTLEDAQAELDVLGANIAVAFPEANRNRVLRATPLLETIVRNIRTELTFVFGAVVCVLLVTCINVVHVSLANAAGRRVELATRVALGATRGHLIRQTLTESALLAMVGGVGGLLVAASSLRFLLAMAPAGMPRAHEIDLEWTTVLFAAGVTVAVALLCGLAASLPISRVRPWGVLSGARSGETIRGRRFRRALTSGEIAIALMLVVAAILMVRTIRSLVALDLGFDPAGVVTASLPRPSIIPLDPSGGGRMRELELQVIEQVRQLPGVLSAGVGGSPMGLQMGLAGVKLDGDTRDLGPVSLTPVSVGYFEALGARLQAGRLFSPDDRTNAEKVAVVSESTARRFWPGRPALDQVLIIPVGLRTRIVGVVGDMADVGLVTKGGGIYVPHTQLSFVTSAEMAIRTTVDPQTLVPGVRAIVRDANPEWPFSGVTTLQQQIDAAMAPRRFVLRLVGLFAAFAVVLAMIGVYGVMAESVAERVREIGVRMALGARRVDVGLMILRQSAWIVVSGVAIGIAGAVTLRQQLAAMVFGVTTLDPASYVVAVVLLAAAAFLACSIPARAAANCDPVIALRSE